MIDQLFKLDMVLPFNSYYQQHSVRGAFNICTLQMKKQDQDSLMTFPRVPRW